MIHKPVLLNEVIKMLDPRSGEFFIDGTLGSSGHATEIIRRLEPNGQFLGIDWDPQAIENFRLKPKTYNLKPILINDNYARIPEILKENQLPKADGLLLDLGFSSVQLEESGRGFSFKRDEPLIMTYSKESTPVYKILSSIKEEKLTEILRKFGEERYAKHIARAIIERQKNKPIKFSRELAEIVKSAVPKNYEHGRIHPAARTFQALRIYANKELENLEFILKNLDKILKLGGRAAIISFHSLEDRLVKNYFRDFAKTKKPIRPSPEEIANNPRSRSAKLRVAKIT